MNKQPVEGTNGQNAAYKRRWASLAFIVVSLMVISLDNTVLNLALPSISKDLGASATGLQWIADAYVLLFAGMLLTMGSISDRFGRKRVLLSALAVFGLLSLGAALSRSSGMLITMRGLMGIAGAAIMPSTLSIITATFRDSKERAQAIALWSAAFALAMGVGPLVGGVLLTNFHWSSVFYINLPIVTAALIGGYKFIQDSKSEKPRPIDVPGCIFSILGLFSLVYSIIQAGIDGWTAVIVLAGFALAVLFLTAFISWERRVPDPLLPLKFFKNPSFTGANLALTLVTFTTFGSLFLISQYLQSIQGYSPIQSGVRLLPLAGAAFVGSVLSARIARAIGTKFTVAAGNLLSAAGLFYFNQILAVDTGYGLIALAMVITAFGFGFTMGPATNSVMGSIPVDESGVGSAMNDTTRQVGGAFGIAVIGTILNLSYLAQVEKAGWIGNLPVQLVEMVKSSVQGAIIAAGKIPDPQLSGFIVDEAGRAFTTGMSLALVVASIIMAAAAFVSLVVLPSQVRPMKRSLVLCLKDAGNRQQ